MPIFCALFLFLTKLNTESCLHPLPLTLLQSLLGEIYNVEIIWQVLVIFLEANSLKSINISHADLKISPNFLLVSVVLFVDLIYALLGKVGL